jgi:peptide/nickel transport system substrate-binding protein
LLSEARQVTDEAARAEKYAAVVAILHKENPTIYLYFEPRIFAMSSKLQGFRAHPDGMVRFGGLKLGS